MKEKLAFTLVLGIGVLLDFILSITFIYLLKFDAFFSISLSFVLASIFNYYANFYLVFRVKRNSSFVEMLRYLTLMLVALTSRVLVYDAMIKSSIFPNAEYVGLLVAYCFSYILNYIFSKYFIFKF